MVARLAADPERPWIEWKDRKPITQRQLADLLRPFEITSETVHIPGLKDAMGYKRVRFEEAWEAYLPGQNALHGQISPSEVPKYPSADEAGISDDFGSTLERSQGTSRNDNLSHSDAGLGTWVLDSPVDGRDGDFDQAEAGPTDDAEAAPTDLRSIPKNRRAKVERRAARVRWNAADDLDIPTFLDRRPKPETFLTDDDIEFLESGKFK